MEIRKNPITGEPMIFAPERAGRPNDFVRDGAAPECPFCPGKESETPPEVLRVGEPWRVRVFPNKYPFAPHHEVIVESPDHAARFAELANPREVVAAIVDRIRTIGSRSGVRHVVWFRNDGATAGASLAHLHSQVAGISFVPPRVERESHAFRSAARCPLCGSFGGITVGENETFRALRPHARAFEGETWIAPKGHQNDIAAIGDKEVGDFAAILQSCAARTGGPDADHNWMLLNFTSEVRAHWYVQIVARTTPIAGFELATGTFIDAVRDGD